jgi:hypothetical protein
MMSTPMKSAKRLFRTTLIAGIFFRRRPRCLLAGLLPAPPASLAARAALRKAAHVDVFADQPAERRQQSLTASSMNNAAGIMSYCAKQKLASVTNTENVKNQVLDKLGLSTPEKQKQDTSYLEGLQGF